MRYCAVGFFRNVACLYGLHCRQLCHAFTSGEIVMYFTMSSWGYLLGDMKVKTMVHNDAEDDGDPLEDEHVGGVSAPVMMQLSGRE